MDDKIQRGFNLNGNQSSCYYKYYQSSDKWMESKLFYINQQIDQQPMFTQQFSFYPQDLFYYPQFTNSEIQYMPCFTQLPTTYQNLQYDQNQYLFAFPTYAQTQQSKEFTQSEQNKSDDGESTLEKSQEKKTYKKISIFKYPKKNAESNIINQIFSFLSLRIKSESILEKILDSNKEKIQNFYQVLKQLKKKNKKYINRCYIRDLVFFEQGHPGQKIINQIRNKGSKNCLSVQEFKKALRIMVSFYLKSKCISTVVTSRKLDKETMKEHLHRKREVHEYFRTQMEILKEGGDY